MLLMKGAIGKMAQRNQVEKVLLLAAEGIAGARGRPHSGAGRVSSLEWYEVRTV